MIDKYEKTAFLLDNKHDLYPTIAYSILSKYIDGDLYIDTEGNAALLGIKSGIYVIAGDSTNIEIHNLMLKLFNERILNNKRFTLFSPSKEWDERIETIFGNRVRPVKRYSFHFNPNTSFGCGKEIHSGFKLSKTDKSNIAVSEQFNEGYYREYWGEVNNFLDKGIGFYLKDGDKIAGECVSIFASPKYAEIDIVTNTSYRGMGVATELAKAFIVECRNKQLTPRWDCAVDNLASIKLAEKLGFDSPKIYSVFIRNT